MGAEPPPLAVGNDASSLSSKVLSNWINANGVTLFRNWSFSACADPTLVNKGDYGCGGILCTKSNKT